MDDLNLVNNEFLRQFEVQLDDQLARIEYSEQERKIFLTKISIPESIQNKKFEEAKFKFEQDIVFNPKSELSYLYLSKIFKNLKNKILEEQNLNTVILLNPKNEEAIFNLAILKLENSDYKRSKELNERLQSLCTNFCKKSKKLKIEIENLSKK